MAIYLLVKEHAYTGLKYLCKHVASSFSECEEYKGSGTYWKRHLKQHGNHVKTTCLFVTENEKEFREVAKKYSLEFNIIESKEWANLCNEEGQGGNTVVDKNTHSEKTKLGLYRSEVREKHLAHLKEQVKITQPLAAKAAKEKLTGVPKTEHHKEKMRGKRPHVIQLGNKNNNAKGIQTPYGTFGSIREASQQIEGHTYKMIWDRLQNDSSWRYIKFL
jgi:hypothetical protein